MLNSVPAPAVGRSPRAIVLLGGVRASGLLEAEVDNNSLYQADAFRVVLSLSQQPPAMNWAWWADQTEVVVEVFLGVPADPQTFSEKDLTSYIVGRTDGIEIDPAQQLITLTGRDFTSVFIDSKTAEKFPNKKSSDIATLLAERHALTPVVTPTKVQVGRFYTIEHSNLTNEITEWDLLTWLAQQENFNVFVKGRELHFEPKPDPSSDPYIIQYEVTGDVPQSNAKRLSFARNLTLANDVIVKVRSWNWMQYNGFTVQAKATHQRRRVLAGLPQPTGNAQIFTYSFPNLTREQAVQKAQSLLAQITQHEVRLQAFLPGDDLLTPRVMVQVTGTRTSFDTTYFPDHVVRRMSAHDGYTMELRAKNHATDSVVSL